LPPAAAIPAHLDQALAELFVRSGWTQEQLAAEEGKKQAYISQRLVFGRFLGFIATAINPEFTPIRVQLTERHFRHTVPCGTSIPAVSPAPFEVATGTWPGSH
jgi:hypothetical protein